MELVNGPAAAILNERVNVGDVCVNKGETERLSRLIFLSLSALGRGQQAQPSPAPLGHHQGALEPDKR